MFSLICFLQVTFLMASPLPTALPDLGNAGSTNNFVQQGQPVGISRPDQCPLPGSLSLPPGMTFNVQLTLNSEGITSPRSTCAATATDPKVTATQSIDGTSADNKKRGRLPKSKARAKKINKGEKIEKIPKPSMETTGGPVKKPAMRGSLKRPAAARP